MVDPRLRALLVCPSCHGELRHEKHSVTCLACETQYPVEGQVPVMISHLSNDGFGHDLFRAQLSGNFFEKVFHSNRILTLMRLIESELDLPSGARVLDVGCNTGPMVIPLRQQGYDVVGIDISPNDVHQAERYLQERSLPDDRLAVADGTQLPFRDQGFDLILLVDILEHTDYPERIVSEARRMLTPGGMVIATVPWAYHPYVRFTWIRKLLSSRKTIDEHPDAPFEFQILRELFVDGFRPVLSRLVFHWGCILGVYQLAEEAVIA